ncbi:PREDICTED: complement receptor type 2-like isoform X1 [Thamnophis sirtalis]|uniref:Complement receptor type 2-like isoform X1 n=1 Tax=Thamnophis sirtalis TaxID=35019 RepID=A0A6I9XWB5_9SAUR|nr:PREDICTED: complement receptor type 2-like isoform X1 [Thamnophis sirtalis]
MIGNYLIRCEKNNNWVPIVPSCKNITSGICGSPSILNGDIEPLQPQYETGKTVVITCNRNYSFIDDTIIMTIQCQGYNLWHPPAQLCLCNFIKLVICGCSLPFWILAVTMFYRKYIEER